MRFRINPLQFDHLFSFLKAVCSLASSVIICVYLVAVVRIVAGIFRMSGHKVLKKMAVEHWNEGK